LVSAIRVAPRYGIFAGSDAVAAIPEASTRAMLLMASPGFDSPHARNDKGDKGQHKSRPLNKRSPSGERRFPAQE
jgi:hypothetical protein